MVWRPPLLSGLCKFGWVWSSLTVGPVKQDSLYRSHSNNSTSTCSAMLPPAFRLLLLPLLFTATGLQPDLTTYLIPTPASHRSLPAFRQQLLATHPFPSSHDRLSHLATSSYSPSPPETPWQGRSNSWSTTECTKIAHHHSPRFFTADSGMAGNVHNISAATVENCAILVHSGLQGLIP